MAKFGRCILYHGGMTAAMLLLVVGTALGQRPGRTTGPPANVGGTPQTQQRQGDETDSLQNNRQLDLYDDKDTFGVFRFYADNPLAETPFSDSLLNNDFQQYDPTRHRDWDWMHLGILGSAAQPIVYQPTLRNGFDVGLHQYDLYFTSAASTPFYRLEKAYTNVAFTQGSEQPDNMVNAAFSRNFAKGVNYTIDYKHINQLGRQSQFPNQNNRSTALVNGLWIHSKKGRYDGFLTFAVNTLDQKDNGGLVTEPARGGEFSSPSEAEVFLANAQTRYSQRNLRYTQYYRLGGGQDSTGRQHRAFTLSHHIDYANNTYKFFDGFSIADTVFYNRFPALLPDERGVRFYLQDQSVENSFSIATFKLNQTRQANAVRRQRDLLEIGLRHAYHRVREEPIDTVFNNLFLEGNLAFQPGDRLHIQAEAQLGLLWANAGDYQVKGDLQWNTGKLGTVAAQFINQLYSPDLLQSTFYLTQHPVWENDFKKTLATHMRFSYSLPKFDFSVAGSYHLLNNFIYFDTLAIARQTGTPVSILQLEVIKDFHLGPIHLDNKAAFQRSSEDVIRLPEIFGKHSLYYEGFIFKVLQVRLGADLRYATTYYADYYNPVIGRFQLQNSREVQWYPALDAFFSMRVTRFRAFVKWENFTSTFIKDRLFYQTAYYANPSAVIRWGIRWRLVN